MQGFEHGWSLQPRRGWDICRAIVGNSIAADLRNSAFLPEHRGKGLYSAMLRSVKDYVLGLGFQEISSRHNTTNNAVIVPKLKQGFTIPSLEVSGIFGTMCFDLSVALELFNRDFEVETCPMILRDRKLKNFERVF